MATPKVELRMPEELRRLVDEEAERQGMTRTAFIVNTMWVAVRRPEDTPVVAAARKRKAKAEAKQAQQMDEVPEIADATGQPRSAVRRDIALSAGEVKVCGRGCEVPVTTNLKRCYPHGLVLHVNSLEG